MKNSYRFLYYLISIYLLSTIFVYGQYKVAGSAIIKIRIIDATSVNLMTNTSNNENEITENRELSEMSNREIIVQFNDRMHIKNENNTSANSKIPLNPFSIDISSNFNDWKTLNLNSELGLKNIKKKEEINILFENLISSQKDGFEPTITLVY